MYIPSRTGDWGQTSVANIINNEVYLGKIRWRRELVKRVVKDGMLAKKRILNDEYAPADYDAVLTAIYGEYMTPPPESERFFGHEGSHGKIIYDHTTDYKIHREA